MGVDPTGTLCRVSWDDPSEHSLNLRRLYRVVLALAIHIKPPPLVART
jgi:hypothetical protein